MGHHTSRRGTHQGNGIISLSCHHLKFNKKKSVRALNIITYCKIKDRQK